MNSRKLTRIAMLSAILYISKVALEFVPNVELVTMLTIIYALVFGAETYLVVTVFNMFELVQWGFGTWWFSYLYVWPLLCLITLLLKRLIKEEFLIWAVAAAPLSGFFIGRGLCRIVTGRRLLVGFLRPRTLSLI